MNNTYDSRAKLRMEYPEATDEELDQMQDRLNQYAEFFYGLAESIQKNLVRSAQYTELMAILKAQERLDLKYSGYHSLRLTYFVESPPPFGQDTTSRN